MKSFFKILFLLLLLAASNAEEEEKPNVQEIVSFINFSDMPIEVYFVDTSTPERLQYLAGTAMPYEPVLTKTFSGHLFVYNWGGAEFQYQVEQTKHIDEDEEVGDDEEIMLMRVQTHVLGDVPPPQNEEEQVHTDVPRKIETKLVVCGTTEGDIRIKIKPSWSPLGAARFLHLVDVETEYFNGCAFNRVVPRFLTQFGIGADYEQRTAYRGMTIRDDIPADPKIPFEPGYMSYAGSGKDSRTTEVFIVMPETPQSQLDFFGVNSWETPFGYVEPEDLDVVAKWYSYGDMAPWGDGPDPQKIYKEDGYEYLQSEFPNMSYNRGCFIVADDDLNEEGEPFVRESYDELSLKNSVQADL